MNTPANGTPVVGRRSTVLAVVPYYRCEPWLGQALDSLLAQTRPPDAIAVIDDSSEFPPVGIVRQFPRVTLLASSQNVGPYRLVQQVINETNYDAYLFQDADDWSAPDRLERLLGFAEETGAELVGSYEVQINAISGRRKEVIFPLNVNGALTEDPQKHVLLHPSSLVSKDLVDRIGGFSDGLRFGADSEFVRRAHHAARVVNLPRFSYFRRRRPDSLTMASGTGLASAERKALRGLIGERALSNARAVSEGRSPDLTPMLAGAPIALRRLLGPGLSRAGSEASGSAVGAGG